MKEEISITYLNTMTFNPNKIIMMLFLACFCAAGASFAQNNIEAMRFLTVNAMMQYGQKLYDRGDFNEASAVFNHVLSYDEHQLRAVQYLKDMGQAPVVSSTPVSQSQESLSVQTKSKTFITVKVQKVNENRVDLLDINSLKSAIEAKKKRIEELKVQVLQMR